MGRFSPDHDQRIGQWIYNSLRDWETPMTRENRSEFKIGVADRLFNMTNDEFIQIMRKGNFTISWIPKNLEFDNADQAVDYLMSKTTESKKELAKHG